MIAYLHKMPKNLRGVKFEMTICEKPCSGEEFIKAEKIDIMTKAQAKVICKELGVKPYNF